MSPLLGATVPIGAAQVAVPVQDPVPPPGQGEEFGKASPVALVVILTLAMITILLIRSMNKRIRRLPASFEAAPEEEQGRERKDEKEKAAGEPADGGSP